MPNWPAWSSAFWSCCGRCGHDIPLADIERRFPRSLRHLLDEFGHRVDRCTCFMNDGDSPVLVFEQQGDGRNVVHEGYYQRLLQEAKP